MEVLTDKVEEMYHMVKNCEKQMESVKNKFDAKANEKNVSYKNLLTKMCRLRCTSTKLVILSKENVEKSHLKMTWEKIRK
jgi:hypothetical protein